MGNVLVPAIYLAAVGFSLLFRRPNVAGPTLVELQRHQGALEAQRQAEQVAREAQEYAAQIRQQAERDCEQARLRQEEADRAAACAVEEAEQLRLQMEEAANAARRAQELSEAAAHAAQEEAAELAREAQAERARSEEMRKDAERAMTAAREEAKRAQQAADEQRREAETAKARAEAIERKAAEETRKAVEAKEEAERCLREGIQPEVIPSAADVVTAKQRIQYRDDCFHFAIAGISGSGKSSLVNAFRGMRSEDLGAAAVGVTETTLQMTRYPDANADNPFVWYDVPGAGTFKCRDWQYFNDQGLYVFDCIIVLFDNRFTMTDVAILANARKFNIPTYIVRSKADQHIRNLMKEMGYDSDEEDAEFCKKLYKIARTRFIEDTRKSVRMNLEDANLPDQRVYIVSNTTMLTLVQNKVPKKTIDEVDLLKDLLDQAYSRRVTN